MKIGIGTVQFGLDYGISNGSGKTPKGEAAAILAEARAAGVTLLDTAPAYGDSETVLGACLPDGHPFRIVTKTAVPGHPFSRADLAELEKAFQESLKRLGAERVYGILVHRVADLLGPDGDALHAFLAKLKSGGLVAKIGVSVYTPAEVDALLGRYPFDLIQLPLNVLDQRMIAEDHLGKLKRAGAEIHVRSAFLQGLLLMDPQTVPAYFNPIKPKLDAYGAALRELSMTPLQGALGFVTGMPEVDTVVCGVNTAAQLAGILASAAPLDRAPFAGFSVDEESFINPSLWKLA